MPTYERYAPWVPKNTASLAKRQLKRELKTFVDVASAGLIRGAAAALVVTAPSVSAAVAALSKELGVQLVERDGRGIRLTTAGRELARHGPRSSASPGLRDGRQRAVREAARGPPTLRLVTVTTAREYMLPPMRVGFRAINPDFQIGRGVGKGAPRSAPVVESASWCCLAH
jgi:DNA-binding transcriptional LysR family regulator